MREPTSGDLLGARISDIVYRLLSGERFSKAELAEHYRVSERTVLRDLYQRLGDLPLQRDSFGRYYLELCDYKPNFTQLQKFAQAFGVDKYFQQTQQGGGSLYELFALILNINSELISTSNAAQPVNVQNFALLLHAVCKQRQISAIYQQKARILEPYRLHFHLGVWYLLACEGEVLKSFALAALRFVKLSDVSFSRDKEVLRLLDEPLHFASAKSFTAVLECDEFGAKYLLGRNLLANYEVLSKSADRMIISTQASFAGELLAIVRQFIPHIRLLEPRSLRTKLISELREYVKCVDD